MKKFDEIRLAFCNYVKSEGCSCCERDSHQKEDKQAICELLKIPKYKDGSGYDVYSIIHQYNKLKRKNKK